MDCVEKYNGWRNFFKNSTGKCEVIHECYTKGKEGELPEIVSASFMQYCRGKAQSLNRAEKKTKTRKHWETFPSVKRLASSPRPLARVVQRILGRI